MFLFQILPTVFPLNLSTVRVVFAFLSSRVTGITETKLVPILDGTETSSYHSKFHHESF